jgi:hypothetical protein
MAEHVRFRRNRLQSAGATADVSQLTEQVTVAEINFRDHRRGMAAAGDVLPALEPDLADIDDQPDPPGYGFDVQVRDV